jgi:hypothetical protein
LISVNDAVGLEKAKASTAVTKNKHDEGEKKEVDVDIQRSEQQYKKPNNKPTKSFLIS